MNAPPKTSRELLDDFWQAETTLSSELKRLETDASAQLTEIREQAESVKKLLARYREQITGSGTSAIESGDAWIPPEIENQFKALQEAATVVNQGRSELKQIRNRLEALEEELEEALAQEKHEQEKLEKMRKEALQKERAARKRKIVRRAIITTASVCAVIALHFWLLSRTILSFDILMDGKPVPVDKTLDITIDGKPILNGGEITLGRHYLSIEGRGVEPIHRNFWAFYGRNSVGALPLETSKGSLLVTVKPLPAVVIVKRVDDTIMQGDAPLHIDKIPVGDYALTIQRQEYSESHPIKIERQQQTETNIALNLGCVELVSIPADATFDFSGNGRHWQGKLPVEIDDIPCGDYSLTVSRNGWDLPKTIPISRGNITTNVTEFQYGSVEVTSEPSGLITSTNGAEIGKTPVMLREVKPGQYNIAVSDGENDLQQNVTVSPKEAVTREFVFHYGAVQLSSVPAGASIIRKGKEIGKTPLTLNHIPVGETMVTLQLPDYESTNFVIRPLENSTTNLSVKLMSQRFLQAMKQARDAEAGGQFADAQQFVSVALESDPDDREAAELSINLSFKIHCQNAERYLTDNRFSDAVKELDEADKLFPNSFYVAPLRQRASAQKSARFDQLIQSAEYSLSRNASDEATSQLDEAEKLYPDNPKVASLRSRMGPAMRSKLWRDFVRNYPNSSLSGSAVLNYKKNLTEVHDGTVQGIKRVLCMWKVRKETKPDDRTIFMVLAPAGILSGVTYPRSCVLMLSQVEDGLVEMRVKFWVYPPDGADPNSAHDYLKVNSDNLFVNLEGPLGKPIIANNPGL